MENLSSFVMRLILLLLPGIIGRIVYIKLVGKKKQKDWEDLTELLLFALISYFTYGILLSVKIDFSPAMISNIKAFYTDGIEINWQETLWSCLLSIIIGYIASILYNYKIINRLGRFLKVTKRYGDEDVWEFFQNIPSIEWVVVRDHKLDLVYYGLIKTYSDSDKRRELLLENVTVYKNSGDFLYETQAMYISRNQYDLTIEVYDVNQSPQSQSDFNNSE